MNEHIRSRATRAQLLARLVATYPARFSLRDHEGLFEIDLSRSYYPSLSIVPRLWVRRVDAESPPLSSGAHGCCLGLDRCQYAPGSSWDADVLRGYVVVRRDDL